MKKLISVVVLACLCQFTFGQSLPNSNFQLWTNHDTYDSPDYWSTPDSILSLLGLSTVSKSTDAFSGSYSAKLETKEIPFIGIQVPGIITLADINIVLSPLSYSVSGGLALHENVSKLTGMYKYAGVAGDSATVLIYNFKHETGSSFDTIGYGVSVLNNASSWTSFTVNMQNLNNHVPDTFNVIIMSSSNPNFSSGAGSILLVDSLAIETNTGIINLNTNVISVDTYPNPVSNFLRFETSKTDNNRKINIYDINGNLLSTNNFNTTIAQVNVKYLSAGLYLFRVSNNNTILNRGSFIKK